MNQQRRGALLALAATILIARGATPFAPAAGLHQQQEPPKARPGWSPETMNIIKARGFIGERYRIRTRDGYSLNIYRIVNPLADPRTLNRIPVAVLHGIGGDSSQLVSQSSRSRPRRPTLNEVTYGPGDECLAFMLANNNFDVFIVDARGANLDDHDVFVDFDPNSGAKYWNFTLDEQALYDTPAIVDFVLGQTGAEKMHYVGYSETTLFMFALLSVEPAYQAKLASFVAMAPVAFVKHFKGAGMGSAAALELVPDDFSANYFPQIWIDTIGVGLRQVCANKQIARAFCLPVAKSFAGLGSQSDPTNYFSTTFKGTSIRAYKHLLQLFKQGRFGMFDYGPAGNMLKYGQRRPPDYNLARVTLPNLVLFRGGSDFLSDPTDQELLLAALGTRPRYDRLIPKFNHLDFLVSNSLLEEVNLPMTRILLQVTRELAAPRPPFRLPQEPAAISNGRRLRPSSVVTPDKVTSSVLRPQSHLLENVLRGVLDQMNTKGGGALNMLGQPLQTVGLLSGGSQLTDVLASRQLQGLGSNLDSLGANLESVPQLLIEPLIN